jgi:hypothetical protein
VKHRAIYVLAATVFFVWGVVLTVSFELLNKASDLAVVVGLVVLALSFIVFPSILWKVIGKTIRQDAEALFGDKENKQ